MAVKYEATTNALHKWAKWWLREREGVQSSPDSILAEVIEYGLITGSGFDSKPPGGVFRFTRQEQMVHFLVQRLAQHDADAAKVVVCHYLLPGDRDVKARQYFKQSLPWYKQTLTAAKAWIDGGLIGMNAA